MTSLLTFFAVTFALTWSAWLAMAAAPSALAAPLLWLGIFAPGLAAVTLTARAEGRSGVGVLLRRLVQGGVAGRWYLFAAGFMIAVELLTALVARGVTGGWPRLDPGGLPLMLAGTVLSTAIGGQAGEELGWRGYALPRLEERLGLGTGSVVLGIVWALWHLPLFYYPRADSYGQSLPLYVVQVTGLSVAMGWLWGHTGGSLLLAMLMHAAVNHTARLVPPVPRPPADPFAPGAPLLGWLGAGVIWAFAAVFLARMPRVVREPPAPALATGAAPG